MVFFRTVRLVLLAVVGCLSVFSASGDLTYPTTDAVKPPHGDRVDRAWKRYQNRDLGYCVSYPSRWARGEAFDGSGLFVATGLHRYSKATGEIDFGPITIPGPEDARLKPASLRSGDLDQQFQDHLAGLRKFARAEKVQVIEQRPLKLQGFEALFVKNQYYDPLERRTWMEELVFISRKSELFRLELQCAPDQMKRFEPIFTYLVSTFELDCK